MKLLLPREHGAWGIVSIPFATAVAVAGEFSLAALLALGVVLLAFLARTPLEGLLLSNARTRAADWSRQELSRWAWVYGLLAAGLGIVLLVTWRLYLLVPLGLLACALFALHVGAARRRREHGTSADLLGTLGLTLSAPVGWVAATGGLDATGALVWLLNAAFFSCGVLYVRARIRARLAPADHRLALGFHLAVVAFVLGLVYWLEASLLLAVPFAVAAARAGWPRPRRGWNARRPPFNLRRLGWTEVALSVFFAGCLTLGFYL